MTDQPTMKSPERLRVGDFFGKDKQGNAVYVKELHELCPEFDGPHIHVLTKLGHSCIPFPRPRKSFRHSGEWSGPVWNLRQRHDLKRELFTKLFAGEAEAWEKEHPELMAMFGNKNHPRPQFVTQGTVTGRFPPVGHPLDRRRKR